MIEVSMLMKDEARRRRSPARAPWCPTRSWCCRAAASAARLSARRAPSRRNEEIFKRFSIKFQWLLHGFCMFFHQFSIGFKGFSTEFQVISYLDFIPLRARARPTGSLWTSLSSGVPRTAKTLLSWPSLRFLMQTQRYKDINIKKTKVRYEYVR